MGKQPVAIGYLERFAADYERESGNISIPEIAEKNGINAVWTPSFDDTEAYLRAHWQPGDIMISHGCGDIDLLNEQIALHGDTPKEQ